MLQNREKIIYRIVLKYKYKKKISDTDRSWRVDLYKLVSAIVD